MLELVTPDFNPHVEIFMDDDLLDVFGSKRGREKFIGKYTVQNIENIRESPVSTKLAQNDFSD
jgi:hypothetical protein